MSKLRGLLLIAILAYLLSASQPRPLPQVIIDESVASDFAALIQETWGEFLAVFAARADCFGNVQIVATKTLEDRAHYDPATATVKVRVPARGSVLRNALVHEWAHHLEFQCPAQMEMRAAFVNAQGFPPGTPWRRTDGSVNLRNYRWATIPSEQFAETVVVVVLGDQIVPTPVRITDEGMAVVSAWANR